MSSENVRLFRKRHQIPGGRQPGGQPGELNAAWKGGRIIDHDNSPDNLELYDENSDHLREELAGRLPNWSEDGKQRIREGVEHRAEQLRGKPSSLVSRLGLSRRHLGVPKSPEQRAKMSESAKRLWAVRRASREEASIRQG